jgi:signal transduction histidine kinase
MKELSLNILDLVQNSIKARASHVEIRLEETVETLSFAVIDDGCGMNEDMLNRVTDPFYTTRTTRQVGLGIPFVKMQAEMTGGYLNISSRPSALYKTRHGTVLKALFYKNHIDFTPPGDMVSTIMTLIQGNPTIHFVFFHTRPQGDVFLDTHQIQQVLGDIPLNQFEVLTWIHSDLQQQYAKQSNMI